jgi:hypothetical protein
MTKRRELRAREVRFKKLQEKFDAALSELTEDERQELLNDAMEEQKEKPH